MTVPDGGPELLKVARNLAGSVVTDDAVLIVSELATNAIRHTESGSQFFTVRAQVYSTYLWLEVEDLGGPWQSRPDGEHPHGLCIVEALIGPDNWGVDGDGTGRVVWARLNLLAPRLILARLRSGLRKRGRWSPTEGIGGLSLCAGGLVVCAGHWAVVSLCKPSANSSQTQAEVDKLRTITG